MGYYGYGYDEDYEKRMAYIRLRGKMQSILNKTGDLESKVENLKSTIKMSLTIDDDIYKPDDYEMVEENIDSLIGDINETLSTINSQIQVLRMNDKVLVKLDVFGLDETQDVFIPVNELVWKIKAMLAKCVSDLEYLQFNPNDDYLIVNKKTGNIYNNNEIIINTDIRNGSELLLISRV